MLNHDEIECNIDEELDNEHATGKNINDSFINRLKDFSSFNPGKQYSMVSIANNHKINHTEIMNSFYLN